MGAVTNVMQATFGGSVRLTGPRRIEADYPYAFITVLMCFPVLLFSVGAVAMLVGALAQSLPMLLLPALIALTAATGMGALARHRWRSMGNFVLDLDQNCFERRRRGATLEHYALSDVQRITGRWDPLHRDFVAHHWLIVETRDGRSYRVGKGPVHEVNHTLALLQSWGLPAQSS
jgi:hypothetical protein